VIAVAQVAPAFVTIKFASSAWLTETIITTAAWNFHTFLVGFQKLSISQCIAAILMLFLILRSNDDQHCRRARKWCWHFVATSQTFKMLIGGIDNNVWLIHYLATRS
jgi:hypothetical protein